MLFRSHQNIILGDRSLCKSESTLHIPVYISKLGSRNKPKCDSEAYELEINRTSIVMKSECSVGLIRAFSTLYQLMERNDEKVYTKVRKEKVIINEAPLKILDEPRFSYRGIMIDSSRHFLQKSTIKRIIDGMMIAKLNVIHWHLSDDDSFPMELLKIPGFVEKTSFSAKEIYRAADIKEIVQYAKENGVRIIPEIDCPGHSRIVGMFPSLLNIVTCFNSVWPHRLENYYRIRGGPPTGVLNPSMDKTYEFMTNVLTDLKEYFSDGLIHLGGDEVPYSCWKGKVNIEKFMEKNKIKSYPDLLSYFIKRTRDLVEKVSKGKTTIYWCNKDTFELKYRDTDILQFWGPTSDIKAAGGKYPKNKFILSPYDVLYLDCGVGNKYGGPSWCANYKTWLQIYLFEPTSYGLPQNRILGAEGAAWGEQIDDSNIELKFWPRMASLAETLWGAKRTDINLAELVKRLNALSAKLNEKGIPSNSIVKQYCQIHADECFQKYKE